MKKSYLLILALLVPILLIPVLAQETEDNLIPSWFKGTAAWWSEGLTSDDEMIDALEMLIDNNIIQLGNNTIMSEQENLSDNEKTLFELQISDKDRTISDRDRTISDLEKNVEEVGLDNSKLLQSIVEKNQTLEDFTSELNRIQDDFQTYKEEYPLKVGSIGGMQVNVETIIHLEERIKDLERVIDELHNEIRELENK